MLFKIEQKKEYDEDSYWHNPVYTLKLTGFKEFSCNYIMPKEIMSKTRVIVFNGYDDTLESDETTRHQVDFLGAENIKEFEEVWDIVKRGIDI